MINPEAVLLLRSDSSSAIGLALLLVTGLWLMPVEPVAATPALSVDALLALCKRGDAQAGVGVEAAFCEWYLLPCDCKLSQPGQPPRWCLPESEPLALAQAHDRVLLELERIPDPGQAATEAVERILERLYPCAWD